MNNAAAFVAEPSFKEQRAAVLRLYRDMLFDYVHPVAAVRNAYGEVFPALKLMTRGCEARRFIAHLLLAAHRAAQMTGLDIKEVES